MGVVGGGGPRYTILKRSKERGKKKRHARKKLDGGELPHSVGGP